MKKKFYFFHSHTCGVCKMIAPIIDQLEEEYKDIEFIKVYVDDEKDYIEKYNISSLPTLIIEKDNKEITRHCGWASKDKLIEMLNQ